MGLQRKVRAVTIRRPDDPQLDALREQLATMAPSLDEEDSWPSEQLRCCAEAGVYSWFLPETQRGEGWSQEWLMRGYMALAQGCTTTAFLITQRAAAIRRIVASGDRSLIDAARPAMVGGSEFVTIGISHLTTSQRHLGAPAVLAKRDGDEWRITGRCPWVSGVDRATWVVVGAATEDGQTLEMLIPRTARGVSADAVADLTALQASRTGGLILNDVRVPARQVLAGPKIPEPILGTGTGGLHTSALAVGLARRALSFIEAEALQRRELQGTWADLARAETEVTRALLLAAQDGSGDPVTLRVNANLLVNRACSAALIAAKGAGFVSGHPISRASREALFFWVWSCPAAVSAGCFEQVGSGTYSG